jgi:hypothetical protein
MHATTHSHNCSSHISCTPYEAGPVETEDHQPELETSESPTESPCEHKRSKPLTSCESCGSPDTLHTTHHNQKPQVMFPMGTIPVRPWYSILQPLHRLHAARIRGGRSTYPNEVFAKPAPAEDSRRTMCPEVSKIRFWLRGPFRAISRSLQPFQIVRRKQLPPRTDIISRPKFLRHHPAPQQWHMRRWGWCCWQDRGC